MIAVIRSKLATNRRIWDISTAVKSALLDSGVLILQLGNHDCLA